MEAELYCDPKSVLKNQNNVFKEYNCLNLVNKKDLGENEDYLNRKIASDSENWSLTLGLLVVLENIAKMKE